MECVLNNGTFFRGSGSVSEYTLHILREVDAEMLKNEEIVNMFENSLRIIFQTAITENLEKIVETFLINFYHKRVASEMLIKNHDNLHSDPNQTSLLIEFAKTQPEISDIHLRIFRECIRFIHFNSSKCSGNSKFEFVFPNYTILYKNIQKGSLDECTPYSSNYEYSLIILNLNSNNTNPRSSSYLSFLRDFIFRLQFETFLNHKHETEKISEYKEIIEELINAVENVKYNAEIKGVIFPPLEIISEADMDLFLESIKNIKLKSSNNENEDYSNVKNEIIFIEIQIKITISNFHNLNTFTSLLTNHSAKLPTNLAFTLIFYNIKQENVNMMVELLLRSFLPLLQNPCSHLSNFFLKLYFVLYESNSVDYRYYTFKTEEHLITNNKKGGLRNLSRVTEKAGVSTKSIASVSTGSIEDKEIENIEVESVKSQSTGSNWNVNPSWKHYLIESSKRKFILDNQIENFSADYNQKFLEFYKYS